MDAVRRLASLARSAREDAGVRVRQPIARMRVAVPVSTETDRLTALLPLLAQEVNVRDIELVSSDADLVRLVARPNFRALGKRFDKRTPLVAAAAQLLDSAALRDLEAGGRVTVTTDGESAELSLEDVEVVREVVTDWVVGSHGPFVVALDPVLTPELRQEGLARELVNRVQRLRKEAGLEYTDRITLSVDGPPELLHAVEAHASFIRGETLTRDLVLGPDAGREATLETITLDGLAARVAVRRHAAPSPSNEPQPMDAS